MVDFFNRAWQKVMIRIARAHTIRSVIQPMVPSSLVDRYVAGPSPASGAERAVDFHLQRLRSSLFFVGEYVNDGVQCGAAMQLILELIARLAHAGMDIHISVDPTAIGYLIDPELCSQNAAALATAIAKASSDTPGVHCLMLDMEDESLVDYTIRLHNSLKALGLPVALTLQAYLKRTENDLEIAIEQGCRIRLVKGAFAAAPAIAYAGRRAISSQYLKLTRRMLLTTSRQPSFYPIFGTHDQAIQLEIVDLARSEQVSNDRFEFEMLMGVRPDLAFSLASQGFRVRIYVSCGPDWWGYVIRRLGESPRNAVLILKAICS